MSNRLTGRSGSAEQYPRDIEPPGSSLSGPAKRFLVTGSSGLVGSALTAVLERSGHDVCRLVRSPEAGSAGRTSGFEAWDPAAGRLSGDAVSGFDVVVHLAGAGIADKRWTEERKREIRDSRVLGTDLLARTLAAAPSPPAALICASAVGYYGDRGEMPLDEGCAAGSGFLADVGRDWEHAARPAVEGGIRVVHLRIGVVLSRSGGALARMLPPFKLGLGGPLGSGRQFWSWITLDDLVGVILHAAASDDMAGPVNAVSPEPIRNADFTAALGKALRRPTLFRIPAAVLRLILGEMGEELLLASTRVVPSRLIEAGFEYMHPDLDAALRGILGQSPDRTIEGPR